MPKKTRPLYHRDFSNKDEVMQKMFEMGFFKTIEERNEVSATVEKGFEWSTLSNGNITVKVERGLWGSHTLHNYYESTHPDIEELFNTCRMSRNGA